MNALSQKIIIGLFIAITIGVVSYAFGSLEKMDNRIQKLEDKEHTAMAALKVLEVRAEERTARIEERIAALRREVTERCSRIESLLTK